MGKVCTANRDEGAGPGFGSFLKDEDMVNVILEAMKEPETISLYSDAKILCQEY